MTRCGCTKCEYFDEILDLRDRCADLEEMLRTQSIEVTSPCKFDLPITRQQMDLLTLLYEHKILTTAIVNLKLHRKTIKPISRKQFAWAIADLRKVDPKLVIRNIYGRGYSLSPITREWLDLKVKS